MRVLPLGAYLSIALARTPTHPQLDAPVPPSLDAIYGTKPKVSKRARRSTSVKNTLKKRPSAYYSMRQADNCSYPIDLLMLVDATASTRDDRQLLVDEEIPQLFKLLEETHPDSRVGLMSFKDKPIPTLGWEGDYCERLDVPLAAMNLDDITNATLSLWVNGGGDPAENQFGTIIRGLQDSTVGWEGSELSTKLVVLMTDSVPHFADDGLNNYGLADYDPTASTEARCTEQYYPSPEQVRQVQQDTEAYLITLVFGAIYGNTPIESWTWYNEFVGQPAEFVSFVSTSADWWANLGKALAELDGSECIYGSSSSTEEETTTEETTVEATTTTTEEETTTEEANTTEGGAASTLPQCEAPPTAEIICKDLDREVLVVVKDM